MAEFSAAFTPRKFTMPPPGSAPDLPAPTGPLSMAPPGSFDPTRGVPQTQYGGQTTFSRQGMSAPGGLPAGPQGFGAGGVPPPWWPQGWPVPGADVLARLGAQPPDAMGGLPQQALDPAVMARLAAMGFFGGNPRQTAEEEFRRRRPGLMPWRPGGGPTGGPGDVPLPGQPPSFQPAPPVFSDPSFPAPFTSGPNIAEMVRNIFQRRGMP